KIGLLVFQVGGEGNLARRMTAETIELMHLSEFFHQGGARDAVAQLPAGTVIYLSKGEGHEASVKQIGVAEDRRMRYAVEDKMLIDLIGVDEDIRAFDD